VVKSDYFVILKFLKEKIDLHIEKKRVSANNVVFILKSLHYLAVVKGDNRRRLLEMGFDSVLFEMIKTDDLTIVQHALVRLAYLSISFSSEESGKLFRGGVFDVFSKLFARLAFVTSALPLPHFALQKGFGVVKKVVVLYGARVGLFLGSKLAKTVMNVMGLNVCSLFAVRYWCKLSGF
jgi:hypothetical protein